MATTSGDPPDEVTQASGLEAHLGFWLRRVSNRVSSGFSQALQSQGVSVAEWVSLRVIQQRGRLTPGQLARDVAMTPGAMSKVVDKLEDKGLIARTPDRSDQRAHWLSLTRSAKRLLPKLVTVADQNDDHFFGRLTQQEQATLMRLLRKLVELHRLRDVPMD